MAVVTPLNNPGGPESDTVTVDEQLLNTEYCPAADRSSESLTLSERGGKWESDQEREREKGRLNEGHGGSV